MSWWNRFRIYLKALLQLGLGPTSLYLIYRLGLATGHFRRMERRAAGEIDRLSTEFHPLFSLPDASQISHQLGPTARAGLLRRAAEIGAGKVRIFGSEPAPLTLTFKPALSHWTAYVTGKAQLPMMGRGKARDVDLKFLWEPARFGWAFTLSCAFHLTKQEKHAEAFWRYFEKFRKGNPAYLGPHWMNGQEVAIRLLALVWCAQVLSPAKASTPQRLSLLTRSIAEHAARIPPTLVYARSQENNHLITESAALVTAGAALNHKPWLDLGWHWLNYAFQHQIGTYGEYVQHSTNYHRLMLQSVLWVDAILRGRREVWPPKTLESLRRAAHWLFSMLDPVTGGTPNLGANDGALILPLSAADFDDYRPTLQAAARAFLRVGLTSGGWDDLSMWLALPATKHTAGPAAYASEHLRGRDSWAYLRASSFKSRLSHMDQLHFDLWWHGLNIAQDAGTYLYNAPAPWANPLVTTRVHNTVIVDGHDQMTRGGRFLTLDWRPAYSRPELPVDPTILGRVVAHHDAYRSLGIRHERLASVSDADRWEVVDRLILRRSGRHVFRLHWLLLDGEWRLEEGPSAVRLRLRTPRGWVAMNISCAGPTDGGLRLLLVRAGEVVHGQGQPRPYEGWVSHTYGQKSPALSLAVDVTSSRSFSFSTEFVLPARRPRPR
jgi:heparinase II/III-like protein